MDPLTAEQQLEFLAGNAPAEVYDIYEASSIREVTKVAGLEDYFDASDAINAALATEGQMQGGQVAQAMQQAAANILRFRSEINLDAYGLNGEDLINMSLGIKPNSGMSEAEIREAMSRAQSAARGFVEGSARPYTGFTDTGTPQAASLGGARSPR
jgi:hypothetical protein